MTTLTVTNTLDHGPGSLRAAIEEATGLGAGARIEFAIGERPVSIRPGAPLPPLAFGGLVDGWTQPGFDNAPLIEVNGADAGTGPGLEIVHDGLTVRGVAVTSWAGDGVFVHDCDGVVLVGLHTGVGVDGITAAGNAGSGVHALRATGCIVGGPGDAAVVASGNGGYGILYDEGANAGRIEGCFVGTDRSGRQAVPNQLSGIRVIQAGRCRVGGTDPAGRNVLSGNVQYGLEIVGPRASNAVVTGNHIGTDVTGTVAVPNDRTGILVYSSSGVRVGGPTPGEGNVISGNLRAGVTIDGAFSALPEYPYSGLGHCHDNTLQGNLIGVDRSGELPLPNHLRGVLINHAQQNIVLDNVICANTQDGVLVLGPEDNSDPHLVPTANRVLGNRIGVTPAGKACGNGRHGVFVRHAQHNEVGGDGPGEANVVASNGGRGVMFSGAGALTNVLSPLNDLKDNAQGPFHQPRS